ncbi:2-oxo acid dehydrogenase subunit E2 [Jiangella sp. DSM 45060]|uniref:2-oxo acid dehydrogenase subunit E2 n=1 Tax=Jiangella sp. DSM 45060 TaxID=1798224 RepID=UPI00087CAE5A|nr:2-oxo acid dehydrogenase subunit E2 [Jiangella sp. DSM 45060]SDT71138.1 pyruvate dehydrogenase E2 component (dihydrolipoamide acetyltransferase) [Jiangella sp. DSM 45060]
MTDYPIPGEERTFRLPDLGEGLTEAEIVAWRVSVGDVVGVDDVVVDVETAKATVEVPCPHAGRVVTLHGDAGSTIEVGAPLITVAGPDAGGADGAGEAGSGGDAAESGAVLVGYGTGNATLARRSRGRTTPVAASATDPTLVGASGPASASAAISAEVTPRPAGRAPTLRAGTDNLESATHGDPAATSGPAAHGSPAAGNPSASGAVAASGPASAPISAEVTPRPAGRAPTLRAGTDNLERATTGDLAAHGDPAATGSPAAHSSPVAAGGAPRVLSPVVRRLARDHGVDVRVVRGSGPGGVILRRDVEAAATNGTAAINGTATAARQAPQRTSPPAPSDRREPLRGVRRAVAEKLSRSRREIPDATTWVDVDATGLVEARDALRAAAPQSPVGLLALLGRITVAALARFPELNASVEQDGDDLVLVRHQQVGLGFAAQTDRGLVVPVVHNAQELTTAELAAELARLTDASRAGTLTPADLTGGTVTLNNYGVFGVDGSTPIINHPEAALLGVGRIVDKPWVVDGQLAVRKVAQLSLSFDHRVCDGGVAGGFLRYVADRVESPLGLLLDL